MSADLVESSTNPNAARCQLIEAPIASPGSCGICGKSKHDKGFVDVRLDFEFYGTLIFCSDCALDIGSPVGGMSPTEYSELSVKYSESILTVRELTEQLEKLQVIHDFIVNYYGYISVPDSSGSNVRELVQSAEFNESNEGNVIELRNDFEESEFSNLNTPESVSVEGSDDVSDATSDSFLSSLGLD